MKYTIKIIVAIFWIPWIALAFLITIVKVIISLTITFAWGISNEWELNTLKKIRSVIEFQVTNKNESND
jgi:hypothetical protein